MKSSIKTHKALSIFAIIILGALVYSDTYFCSFHFDDLSYIVHDFAIRNIRNLADIWNVCPCRFITFLSLALNYHFDRLDVLGYHLFNMAVHLISAILVWWLTLLTFSTPAMKQEKIARHAGIIALFAGLIFVSHPVQIEAVTYIWQRAASMAALFYLASLSLYVRSRLLQDDDPTSGSVRIYYIFSLITAVAAMFTKENSITLPLMILLYESSFFKTKKGLNWGQLYPFWLIMFIIPQTMVLTRSTRFQEIHSIVGGPAGISPIDYLLTQFRVMITYIRLLFLPFNLNLDYDYPVFKSFFEMPVLTSLILLSVILYSDKRMFSKYRLLSFSIFWFFLTLLPESSILPQEDVIFEHRLYLPLAGYCMFLASGAYYLLGKDSLKTMVMTLSLIVAFNSFLTYQRNKAWINESVLWEDVIKKSPHKARPYINRGLAYYNQGNDAEAMSDYDKATEISPEFVYPYNYRGLIYARQGKVQKAVFEYNKAIGINPYYAEIYDNRGRAFLKLHNDAQALSDYNKAIEIDPEYLEAYVDRGQLYKSRGDLPQAKADHAKAVKIDPNVQLSF